MCNRYRRAASLSSCNGHLTDPACRLLHHLPLLPLSSASPPLFGLLLLLALPPIPSLLPPAAWSFLFSRVLLACGPPPLPAPIVLYEGQGMEGHIPKYLWKRKWKRRITKQNKTNKTTPTTAHHKQADAPTIAPLHSTPRFASSGRVRRLAASLLSLKKLPRLQLPIGLGTSAVFLPARPHTSLAWHSHRYPRITSPDPCFAPRVHSLRSPHRRPSTRVPRRHVSLAAAPRPTLAILHRTPPLVLFTHTHTHSLRPSSPRLLRSSIRSSPGSCNPHRTPPLVLFIHNTHTHSRVLSEDVVTVAITDPL